MSTVTDSPETLRTAMVDKILAAGHATTLGVEQTMRTVPRHEFVPAASHEDAYAEIAVITKRASDGTALSCASVPTIVAMMLDQLQVRPGNRVLEIGAGTGYNAALIAQLTGLTGQVTTVDIDPQVAAGARQRLDATGYRQVEVIARDGSLGADENAPYDRIIFTVGAWDLIPAFWEQLAPSGRIVVPLRWRGQTRSVAFVREDDALRSESIELCGFVPMVGQEGERSGYIDRDALVCLYWDGDQSIDAAACAGVLEQPRQFVWSGVTVGSYDPFDGIWLRLTGTDPRVCRIAADAAAVESGMCTPAVPARSPALVDGDSLAYFALRRTDAGAKPRFELGAIGHGPIGQQLAERLCEEIRLWDGDREARPTISAYPADTPDSALPAGLVIAKPDSRLVIGAELRRDDLEWD